MTTTFIPQAMSKNLNQIDCCVSILLWVQQAFRESYMGSGKSKIKALSKQWDSIIVVVKLILY